MENDMTSQNPVVQFAGFENGTFKLFHARTDEVEYIAISHVWGDIDWRFISIVGREVLISEQKARFVQEELPRLVGNTPFWMDTLTVNQRDKAEVIATVQLIPAIFRGAMKTVAIRECDGLYTCCTEAAEGIEDESAMWQSMSAHIWEKHHSDLIEESFLRRLWCFQECLLSHTILFVSVAKGEDIRTDTKYRSDPFATQTNFLRVLKSLGDLAKSFCNDAQGAGDDKMLDFKRAYIFNRSVSRKVPPVRTWQEDIYSQRFWISHRGSGRSATMARDYVFATMPQFPWYHYPANAENMTFNEIFTNLYDQALNSGHHFVCRITHSMTIGDNWNTEDAWKPSRHQPEPATLGDFLKLFGLPLSLRDITQRDIAQRRLHSSEINVQEIGEENFLDEDLIFDLMKSAMYLSQWLWAESQRGGELTHFGSWPQDDPAEYSRCMLEEYTKNLHDPEQCNAENKPWYESRVSLIRSEMEKEDAIRESDEWTLPQARRIISNMWGSVDPTTPSATMKGEWRSFVGNARGKWSANMLKTLLLLSTMLGCQIPLSAANWAKEHFVPVRVVITKGKPDEVSRFSVMGLLSKHASKSEHGGVHRMLYGRRHFEPETEGKDAVLMDPTLGIPVGLLPDLVGSKELSETQWVV